MHACMFFSFVHRSILCQKREYCNLFAKFSFNSKATKLVLHCAHIWCAANGKFKVETSISLTCHGVSLIFLQKSSANLSINTPHICNENERKELEAYKEKKTEFFLLD